MDTKTALVAGASGLVGSELLSLLLAGDYYSRVIAVGRRKLDMEHPRLEQRIIAFDHLEKEIIKASHIYCCLGTTMKKAGSREQFRKVDYAYPLQLASAALKQGAEQYLLVTALGADKNSKIFYNRIKGETEVAVARLPFRALHIFRPSLLLGHRKETRTGEGIAQFASRFLSFLMVGPLKKYRPISAETVARGMYEIARREVSGIYIFESDKIKLIKSAVSPV